MRIQISRTLAGSVDGVRLDTFRPGRVYDIGVSLACYLLAIEAVDLAVDERSPLEHRQLPPIRRRIVTNDVHVSV